MEKHTLKYTGEQVDTLLDTVNQLPTELSTKTYLPEIIYQAQQPTLVDFSDSIYSESYGIAIPFTPELDAIYNLKMTVQYVNTYGTLGCNLSTSGSWFTSSDITESGKNSSGDSTYVVSEYNYPIVLDITFSVVDVSDNYNRYYRTTYNSCSNYYFKGYFRTSGIWNSLHLDFHTSTQPYIRNVILTKLS